MSTGAGSVTIRKKLIEVSIPLEAINKASAREKSIRHGHPSTLHLWWARRPLAACRAVLFSQLVDDPSSWPDRFPTEEAQDKELLKQQGLSAELVTYKANIENAHKERQFDISQARQIDARIVQDVVQHQVFARTDVVAEFAHVMRARDEAHAAVADIDIVQCYPHRHRGARSYRPILAILMPRHFESGRGWFAEHGGGPQNDVRTNYLLDDVEQRGHRRQFEKRPRDIDSFSHRPGCVR